jgi:hypothetical protein
MYPPYWQPPPDRHWADSPAKILGLIAAILSVVTGFLALLAQVGAFGDFRISFLPGRPVSGAAYETSLSLSVGEGRSGTPVVVTGHGFAPGETVEVLFHTELIATAITDENGDFTANAKVPGTFDAFGGQQFLIIAVGKSSIASAQAPFKLLTSGTATNGGGDTGPPKITLSRTSGSAGTQITVTGEHFTPGEEVRIRFHATEVGTAVVGADGRFSGRITIPTSYRNFAPQQFEIWAVGNPSLDTDHRPFNLTG